MPETYITLKEAAVFEGISYETMKKRVQRSPIEFGVKTQPREGKTITTTWTGAEVPYTQSISVPGATASNVIELSLSSSATQAETEAWDALKIKDGGQAAGSITLRCWGDKNTIAIPVTIIVRGDL